MWSLPGGGVEPGETLEQAVAREVAEETGLVVEVGPEVWQIHVALSPTADYDVHAYSCRAIGGVLAASDDADEAKWWRADELRNLLLTPHLEQFLTGFLANPETILFSDARLTDTRAPQSEAQDSR